MQLPEPSTSTVICGSLTTKSAESCACILSFKHDLVNQLTGSPLFCKWKTGSQSLAWVFLKFLLKKLHKSETVRSGAGKAAHNIIMNFSKFLCCILKNSWAKRNLSVCNQGNLFTFAHAEHSRAMEIVLSMRELVSISKCTSVCVRHNSCRLYC